MDLLIEWLWSGVYIPSIHGQANAGTVPQTGSLQYPVRSAFSHVLYPVCAEPQRDVIFRRFVCRAAPRSWPTLAVTTAHVSEQILAWRTALSDDELIPMWHGVPYAVRDSFRPCLPSQSSCRILSLILSSI